MITKRTVFVLGAGASAHYGFPTGGDLLLAAQELTERQLEEHIPSSMQSGISTLYDTLAHTGESSIDAMLETRGDIQVPGKALIARLLLQAEWNVKPKYGPKYNWYRTLFAAVNAPTLSEVLSQPVTFVTFNYDRSLEHFLAEALRVKFTPDQTIDPAGLRRMFIMSTDSLAAYRRLAVIAPSFRTAEASWPSQSRMSLSRAKPLGLSATRTPTTRSLRQLVKP
jgi:hypothetical protein